MQIFFSDIYFNAILNSQKVGIRTIYINKAYVKLNCESNGVNIILYFFKSKEFSLVQSRFFCFLKIQ
jgi:uncharacterized HAD superfamily protein